MSEEDPKSPIVIDAISVTTVRENPLAKNLKEMDASKNRGFSVVKKIDPISDEERVSVRVDGGDAFLDGSIAGFRAAAAFFGPDEAKMLDLGRSLQSAEERLVDKTPIGRGEAVLQVETARKLELYNDPTFAAPGSPRPERQIKEKEKFFDNAYANYHRLNPSTDRTDFDTRINLLLVARKAQGSTSHYKYEGQDTTEARAFDNGLNNSWRMATDGVDVYSPKYWILNTKVSITSNK
jgi:hypothetical protein